ncbi:MAG: hypothetical protein PVG13_05385, partial [Thiohalophilus sp.]
PSGAAHFRHLQPACQAKPAQAPLRRHKNKIKNQLFTNTLKASRAQPEQGAKGRENGVYTSVNEYFEPF